MFRAYLNTLALTLGLSNFAVLAAAMVKGHAPASQDFLLPAAILVVLLSLVFILLKLVRIRDTRIAARTLAWHNAQIEDFKAALRSEIANRPEFSRGIKSWNS